MIPLTTPLEHNSAYDEVNYEFAFSECNRASIDNDGGFARFNLISAFEDNAPAIGEQIYNYGTDYAGFHTIKSVASTTVFTTTTPFTTFAATGLLKHIWLPEISIYKGYNTGESLASTIPIELVASFIPVCSPDITMRFDIAGYLQSIFTLTDPIVGVDVSLFNRFRLKVNGAYLDHYQVYNCGISNTELNDGYSDGTNYLQKYEPIIFACGSTVLSQVQNGKVITTID